MKDHIRPSEGEKPDLVVLHLGINHLNSYMVPDIIAKSIIDLAVIMKSISKHVRVFKILMRNGNSNGNATEVNKYIKQFSFEKKHIFVDHTKTLHARSISKSKLHLSKSETSVLSSNFVKTISNILY